MRSSKQERITGETKITINLNIDGEGKRDIFTGIGFFDHMLDLFAKHGFFDLMVHGNGDTYIDGHHTVEDVGILLGRCIKESLGDKSGIARYGSIILPMDEVLVLCAIDISGRPYLGYDAEFKVERIGEMDTELIEEFFRALAMNAGINLHIKVLSGGNGHHMSEAMFKAFGKALDIATSNDPRIEGPMSTKGMLEV